jgi:hypothetical protein
VAKARFNDLIEIFGIAQYRDQRISNCRRARDKSCSSLRRSFIDPRCCFSRAVERTRHQRGLVVKELLRKLASQGKTIFSAPHS